MIISELPVFVDLNFKIFVHLMKFYIDIFHQFNS